LSEGQAPTHHLDLLLHSSAFPYCIDISIRLFLCSLVILSPIPLVIVPILCAFVLTSSMLRTSAVGRLIFREDVWYLNGEALKNVKFSLALSSCVIAIKDSQYGWRLIWRSSASETSYRHLMVSIKKQPM
jgi:hypothetical protein